MNIRPYLLRYDERLEKMERRLRTLELAFSEHSHPEPKPEAEAPVKRGPGRPRKAPADGHPGGD